MPTAPTQPAGIDESPAKVPGLAALLPMVYQDALAPGVKQVGKALEAVLALVPVLTMPAEWAAGAARLWFDRSMDRLRTRMAGVPAEQVATVPPELGVPIVNRLSHTSDEHLAALYIELLAKAADRRHADRAHPGFVSIIENLCPDEALIIGMLAEERDARDAFTMQYPILELRFAGLGTGPDGIVTAWFYRGRSPLTGWEMRVAVAAEHNMPMYVENLVRLGVLSLHFDQQLPAYMYVPLEEHYAALIRTSPEVGNLNLGQGVLRVTAFGSLFVRACTPMADAATPPTDPTSHP